MECPICNKILEDNYCPDCDYNFKLCKNCDNEIDIEDAFCDTCICKAAQTAKEINETNFSLLKYM